MSEESLEIFLQKLQSTSFKISQEESYLDSGKYTVMHIESVFDILDLIMEHAALRNELGTLGFVNQLDKDIRKSIGREDERYES